MTHEFLHILQAYRRCVRENLRTVLATIVHVDGSSYRKEGTQMLIDEKRAITGALSGGCVEQEVIRQAVSVFEDGCSKIFKYDGRYRLGCEGSIYILLESFAPHDECLNALETAIARRQFFTLTCSYRKEESSDPSFGSSFSTQAQRFHPPRCPTNSENLEYTHTFQPLRRLCIFGIEHDAGKLSQLAYFLGWEVVIIGTEQSSVGPADFPFASTVLTLAAEELDPGLFCAHTAVVVMSHSYSKDLRFLLHVLSSEVPYIGLLGPVHRRERLLNELIEHQPFVDDRLFDKLHGPVGLPIGSETPEEIALSIMAEVVGVFKGEVVV